MTASQALLPLPKRGDLTLSFSSYGSSVRGIPLEVFVPNGPVENLVVAGIHGEEPETTALLSKAARSLREPPPKTALVLSANPDGLLLGTRGNSRAVDLNRNFPATNWSPDLVRHQWERDGPQIVELSPGSTPESEPEVKALRQLVERLQPTRIISVHGPLGWIDDPASTSYAQWMAKRCGLALVTDPGYQTPGSFGTWAHENGYSLITYELPAKSIWEMTDKHLKLLIEILSG